MRAADIRPLSAASQLPPEAQTVSPTELAVLSALARTNREALKARLKTLGLKIGERVRLESYLLKAQTPTALPPPPPPRKLNVSAERELRVCFV